jgi:AraC-like DNA-binding protein
MKTFSTSPLDEQAQLRAWQEIMSEVYYSVEIGRQTSGGLRGVIKELEFGSLSITTFDSDEQRVFRTRARIARDPDDSYVFVMPARQNLFYSQNGRQGIVPPGGYVLVSTSEFYELSCPDGFLNWTVKIPGPELRQRLPNVDDHCAGRFPNDMALARIARQMVRSVAVTYREAPAETAPALANSLIDFIALVLRHEPSGGASERRSRLLLRRRVLDYIRAHLHDPELSPQRIADAHGISLSYTHKLFSDHGLTLGQVVQAQRLQVAYERLAADGDGQLTIAEVAYGAGFRTPSHFSRVFTERFGMTPSAARKSPFAPAAGRLPEQGL